MKTSTQEGQFKTSDDLLLFFQSFHPQGETRGTVLLIHDHGEHCGRYRWLAQKLAENGFSVCIYDQRGHGKSEGVRAYISTTRRLVDDLSLLWQRVRSDRMFLLGQGLGACIAMDFALRKDRGKLGLVFCSPAFRPVREPSLADSAAIMFGSLLLPGFSSVNFKFETHPKDISRDPNAVREFQRDPYVYHGAMRNRTGRVMLRLMKQSRQQISRLTNPLLILHGDADPVMDPGASRELFERARSKQKELKIIPGAYHELFHDLDRQKALKILLSWLKKQTRRK